MDYQATNTGAQATSGSSSSDEVDYAQVAVILAGSYYVLNGINMTIRNLYRYACYQSDPRLLALGLRLNTRSTRVWSWAARVIETTWLPLWFDHQRIRDAAVNEAIENAQALHRAQQARRPPNDDSSDEGEDLQDWREAIDRQRQLGRYYFNKILSFEKVIFYFQKFYRQRSITNFDHINKAPYQ